MTTIETPRIDPLLIDVPMPIVTPRLIIRPVAPNDAAEMHAALTETYDDVHRWMPWAKEPLTLDHYRAVTRRAHAKFILREDFMMIACRRDTGRMAVFTGLHRFDWEIRRMEVGFWARKDAQGHGFVTESTNAIARYAFGAVGARTVCVCHADGNDKSRAVIERLGFHYEGRMKNETILPDGSIRDKLWYSHIDVADLPPLDVTWGGP